MDKTGYYYQTSLIPPWKKTKEYLFIQYKHLKKANN